jgi:hypothetical protein
MAFLCQEKASSAKSLYNYAETGTLSLGLGQVFIAEYLFFSWRLKMLASQAGRH